MQPKEMIDSIIQIAVASIETRRSMAKYIRVIHEVLIHKDLSSDEKVNYLSDKLVIMIEKGKLDASPHEDSFLNTFGKQPKVTDFIDKVKGL